MPITEATQRTIGLSFIGSTLAGFLVWLLTKKPDEFKSLTQIYVEHNERCIPLASFIEVDKPEIQAIASQYLEASKEDYILAVYDWVSSNISYPQDGAAVWYLPSEVLSQRSSGCFGTSVLVASLLRQKVSPEEVYVAIGTYQGSGHAWCLTKVNKEWSIVETTHHNHFEVDHAYNPVVLFNDRKVLGLPGAIDFLQEYICGNI